MGRNMVNCSLGSDNYKAIVETNSHQFYIDEPVTAGGGDTAAAPLEHLLGALASCTAITMKMYAQRKQWDVGRIDINVQLKEILNENGVKNKIVKTVRFENITNEKQITRLLQIGKKCPISKLLSKENELTIKNEHTS